MIICYAACHIKDAQSYHKVCAHNNLCRLVAFLQGLGTQQTSK